MIKIFGFALHYFSVIITDEQINNLVNNKINAAIINQNNQFRSCIELRRDFS